jgi:membrane-associated phospholipid phosphatase
MPQVCLRRYVVIILAIAALLGLRPLPATAHGTKDDSQQVGKWKTFVLSSGSEIAVPPPPAENSDQTKAELAELQQMQKERTAIANIAIQYYNAAPVTQRWHDLACALARADQQSPNRQLRMAAVLHTAFYDTVVTTWAAKEAYHRRAPLQLAPDVKPMSLVTGVASSPEHSYPSEHAAIAGTAVSVLTAFFPKEEANLKAMAAELGQTRMLMGLNYRSDVEAGYALGQIVAQKALARAATDGSAAKWTGTIPIGPGFWNGPEPLEPLQGTWKPWLMTRVDQFRPGPPPAFGSAAFQEELARVKQLSSSPTPSQRAIATHFATKSQDLIWELVYDLIQRERLSMPREVRLLALVAAVQFDAGIAAADTQYTYWHLRPSMADPTIQPYIPLPHYPTYVSNAAITASAVGELVSTLYPQQAVRFLSLGEEAGLSRVFSGIHYPSDERTGSAMGKKLGALALQHDRLNGP